LLLLERLVRDELTLQRNLAAGRRAASARMSMIRLARPAPASAGAASARRQLESEVA
jgi:hypothetical protein